MRPALKPGLRRIWRDEQTLQLGLDPDFATVLTGIDETLAEIIETLAGTRTVEAVVTYAHTRGVPAARTRRLIELLRDCGALDDGDVAAEALHGLRPIERERLRPDLAAASISAGRPDGGRAALVRRRRAFVVVHGAGRVGASIATLLNAAGVGKVVVFDRHPVEPADLAPAGHGVDDVGMSRGGAAMRRLRRDHPRPRPRGRGRNGTAWGGSDEGPDAEPTSARADLVVLAPDEEADRGLAAALVRDGVPHVVARVRELRGIIGPLVVPGATSCLRCHELHRFDRDPGWHTVRDTVESTPLPVRAVDVVLASTVAGIAVLHVLAFLEGRTPPSVDGTVEVTLPFGAARRRTWPVHPGCGCQWHHLDAAEPDPDRLDNRPRDRPPARPGGW